MPKLFRKFRPSDLNIGIYNGENLRLQRPVEGEYTGCSVVEVSGAITVRNLKRDGWELMKEAEEPTPTAPEAPDVLTVGTLADLEAAVKSMGLEELSQALAVERSGRNRKGARKILEVALVAILTTAKAEAAPEAHAIPEAAPEAAGPEDVHIAGEEP